MSDMINVEVDEQEIVNVEIIVDENGAQTAVDAAVAAQAILDEIAALVDDLGEYDQDNIPTLKPIGNFSVLDFAAFANKINSMPGFVVGPKQNMTYLAYVVENVDDHIIPKQYQFVTNGLGKGTYGVGGAITVPASSIRITFVNNPTASEVLATGPQLVNLGEIGATNVWAALDLVNPAVAIQDPAVGLVVINTLVDDAEVNYLFLGAGRDYGVGTDPSNSADFYVLGNEPVPAGSLQDLQSVLTTGKEYTFNDPESAGEVLIQIAKASPGDFVKDLYRITQPGGQVTEREVLPGAAVFKVSVEEEDGDLIKRSRVGAETFTIGEDYVSIAATNVDDVANDENGTLTLMMPVPEKASGGINVNIKVPRKSVSGDYFLATTDELDSAGTQSFNDTLAENPTTNLTAIFSDELSGEVQVGPGFVNIIDPIDPGVSILQTGKALSWVKVIEGIGTVGKMLLRGPGGNTTAQVFQWPDKPAATAGSPDTVAMVSDLSNTQSASEAYTDGVIASLIGTSPTTLDTIQEISDALQDNPDVISEILVSLGKRLRFDINNQGLSSLEKSNALTNLGIVLADLLNRANHTGSQAISTVTGLQAALNSRLRIIVDDVVSRSHTGGTSETIFATFPITAADLKVSSQNLFLASLEKGGGGGALDFRFYIGPNSTNLTSAVQIGRVQFTSGGKNLRSFYRKLDITAAGNIEGFSATTNAASDMLGVVNSDSFSTALAISGGLYIHVTGQLAVGTDVAYLKAIQFLTSK